MKLEIFTTATNPRERMDPYDEALACYEALADNVTVAGADWPHDFKWDYIGQVFDRAYDKCTGDWVIRMDLDYFFHEKDMDKIRQTLEQAGDTPAFSFWKYQFLLVDGYQIKSRPVIAVNRKKYGDRIAFNGGGDLCQPTLDGVLLSPDDIPELHVPVYNYDFSFKTQEVIAQDFCRFTRAWYEQFGKWSFGGPTPEEALEGFKHMMVGRFQSRGRERIALREHPVYIRERLASMTPNMFGHSGFGWFNETADYFKEV